MKLVNDPDADQTENGVIGLIETMSLLQGNEEHRYFLELLLTPREFRDLNNRWGIIQLLFTGMSQRNIKLKRKAAISTVTKASKMASIDNSTSNELRDLLYKIKLRQLKKYKPI